MNYIEGITTTGEPFAADTDSIENFKAFNDDVTVGVIIVLKSGTSFRTDTFDYHGLKTYLKHI